MHMKEKEQSGAFMPAMCMCTIAMEIYVQSTTFSWRLFRLSTAVVAR